MHRVHWVQVRQLSTTANSELHPVLHEVPALELDCGGFDLLNSKDAQLHYAEQVGSCKTASQ